LGPIATSTAVLVMMLPVILGFYFHKQSEKSAPFILIVFLLGSLAVFLSLGKSAILSLAVALIYLFYKFREKRISMAIFSAVSGSMGLLLFFSFFQGLFYRLSMSFMDVSTKFRLLELGVCFKIINENFWTGVGAGQQMIYYSKYLYPDYNQLVNNFFLQSFIDLGIVGFGLAVAIAVLIIRKAIINSRLSSKKIKFLYFGFVASFIAVFLNGQVEVTLFAVPYAIAFWLMVGAFANLNKYN
jgi:O-antigen ligase